jgi:hypothetical protein
VVVVFFFAVVAQTLLPVHLHDWIVGVDAPSSQGFEDEL